jgi:TP901 family phage tail tape measure protein
MAEKTTVILEALMNVTDIESKIGRIQKGLKGLNIPKDIATNLTDSLSKLGPLLKDYKKQLNNGFNTQKDVNSFNALGKKIDEVFSDIDSDIKKINSKEIRLNVDLTEIQKTRADLVKYGKDLETILNSTFNKLSDNLKKKNPNFELTFLRQGPVSTSIKKIGKELVEAFNTHDIEKYQAAYEKLRQTLNSTSASSKTKQNIAQQMGLNAKSINDIDKVEAKVKELLNVLRIPDTALGAFDKAVADLESTDQALTKLLQDAQSRGEQAFSGISDGINNTKNTMKGLTEETSEYGNSVATARDQVRDLQQSTQYFFSLRNMINLLKRGIDEAVQSVKDLDKAMTETAVVTDYKVSDLWGMLPEYTKIANQLGATTQGAYETMTLYYQQGLEQQQAFELGAETMKMARIAGLDYAETTDMMTAALRGFNMELNEVSAKRVNDVYSKLAAVTASDTEELGTAMQRTASIAASAGASFEGTTAFLAQAIETTREPAENIGTAMKTIVARFQEMKKNPLEISEVDGEEVDYNKIDAALKTIGVDLKDANGQFRDFDQVMLDISSRWDSLSQAQQRYIATTAAGSRQQSRFIAMVSNYERTMQLMEAANNSAGASDEQFGKTMDSLESKLNQLHNAWEQFTMGIANNGMIKMAVDGLTGFLNITNSIINALSLGSGALKSFLSVFAAFTGLKMAGRAANSLIGGLGGLVDPQSTMKDGLKNGFFGQGKNAAQAKAITTPIVDSLSKISQQIAQIKNGKISDNSNQSGQIRNTSKQEYLDIKKQFDKLSGKEGFKIGEASKLFSQLDTKHQQAMFNNSPGTRTAMKKASMAWFNSKGLSEELTNEGRQYINSIYKGMQEGKIPVDKGIELIGRPDEWGEYFATDTAKSISKHFELTDNDRKRIADQTWSKLGMKLAAPETRQAWLKENQNEFDRMFSQIAFGHGETQGTVSDMGRFANDIGAVADKFTQAGYGITTFGNALSQLGGPLGMVGSGIAALGGAVSTIGASISGATGIISLFTEGLVAANGTVLVAGSTIAAVAAPLAALAAGFLLVRHHIKKVKEAGEEITKTFSDINKETQDNVTKLKSYQGEFASLSQGVDINGNNVNLDESQYQRYLEIVDDIAIINPAIVKGYNAQGHAILDNNIALEETLRLQEQLQKEAYKTYLSEGSLQALINARNVNTDYGKAVKNLYGGKLEDSGKAGKVSPLTNDVQSLADQLNLSGDRKAAEHILEKYGIESLDALIKGEEQAVKKFVDYQDQIQADLSNFGVDLSEGVIKGFQTLGENTEAFEAAIKPVYDNLLALVSNSSAYKDLAPEMRSALAEGLKGIASQDLGAKEMQQAANYLMREFQDAFDKAQPYLDQADEALNTFTQDLDEAAYNDSASNIAENLRELARQAEAVGQVEIAEWYENQASRIESAITNATYSIADGVDTLADNIAKAKSNFDSLAEGIDDYYTLTDKARGLVDTALEDKNTGGNGSKTFWKTYQGLASEEAFNRHDLDEAMSDMKQFQKYFAEGADGAAAFGQKLIDSQNDAFKFTDNTGKETTKHVRDFFKLADDGTMQITDEFKNLSDEQYSQLAAAFKLSDDGFTAILNNLRQWGDIDFSDPGLIRKALATDARSVTTNKKVAVEGEDEKVSRLYYGESTLRAETPELTNDKREDLVNDLKVQGSIELPSGAENLIKAGTDEKEDGSLLKQFVADTKGTGNQMQNVMASLIKSGEYNKEDLEKIHQSIVDQGLLAGAKDADKSFEDIYSAAELQVTDPATEAANEHLSNISSTVNTIAGIVAAGKVGEGYLPDVAKQSGNLYNELVGKKGEVDTWMQYFAKGRDENGYAITDKAKYNDIYAKLDEYKTANDNYINELKQGRAAAEERGASVAELNAFDEEIKAAEHNAELIDFYFQSAKDSADKLETDFYNAGQTVFQGLADIRNNPNLTPDQQKNETADVLTGFAKQLEGLNFSPEAIAGVFKESFGIELDIKGGEFATDIGEQINEKLKNLDQAEINAVLNIASIKMPGAARGKNNTPSAIRRVGTMARGSKRGYTINGRPTLTGELGPELVWEPRQNSAYMVGEHGPQFANLSKNAVVWNAQQTKKIKKNSKGVSSLGTGAHGIHSFGTMSLGAGAGGGAGTGRGLSIPGTFEINATANVLDVISPTPEPEIPVKAKLEIEGESGGGVLSKLFGGNQGPSINVAANITSINTGEQLQTIQVVGNVTKLNTESTVNDIQASAVVTQVTKGAQVAGEPISVKAVATTTKVKNETPTPKPQVSAGTQTMKVTANTALAQAKINQLIQLFNKTYTLKYKASGPSSISVPIKANFTGSWEKTVKITKSGAKGINNHIRSHSMPAFGSAAAGRYGTIGPKGKGGLTLTGEKGFEIAWLPGENRSMILGTAGPQMLKLPSDVVIYNHEQSKKILKQKGISAGSAPGGTNSAKGNNILQHVSKNSSNSSKGNKSSKKNSKKKNKNKKSKDKSEKEAQKLFEAVNVWWDNFARRTEAHQRIMDKASKAFEKTLKGFAGTADKAKTALATYQSTLVNAAKENSVGLQQAKSQLDNLDKGIGNDALALISYSATTTSTKKNKKGKKKTTTSTTSQQEFVNLGGYINYNAALDTYEIDQAQLDAIANLEQRKAIADAANQKLNDLLSKRNKAEEEIQKARDELDKVADTMYETFYSWEKSINEIYMLSKRLEVLSGFKEFNSNLVEFESAMMKTGYQTSEAGQNNITKYLAEQQTALKEQVEVANQLITAREKEFQNALKADTYFSKLQRSIESSDVGVSEEAIADYQAAVEALKIYENANGDMETAIQRLNEFNDKETNKDFYDRVQKVLDDIFQKQNDVVDASSEALKLSGEIFSQIEDYNDYIIDFQNDMLEGVKKQAEEQIDRLDTLNDSLSKALKNLLDEVKRKLDERRRTEDNAKTESEIARKQQRLAMLRADTSGGHQVEIAQLEKEIADSQQNYQRTLEDQLLDRLQEQADKAEQQRQQQIDLLQAANDVAASNGTTMKQIEEWLAKGDEASRNALKEAYRTAQGYYDEDTSQKERERIDNSFEEAYAKYGAYIKALPDWDKIAKDSEFTTDISNKGQTTIGGLSSAEVQTVHEGADKAIEEARAKKEAALTQATTTAPTAAPAPAGPSAAEIYQSQLAGVKKIAPKNVSKNNINALYNYGAAAGVGKAQVLRDLVGAGGADPFTWANILIPILDSSGVNRWNLVKTFGESSAAAKAVLDYFNITLKNFKKQDGWKNATAFSTGGLADYTGPAWLDGTPSKPELVLNAKDTANFIALKDVLSKAMGSTKSINNSYGGDNIFEININVDKIEKDYDVDRVADRVKKKILESSSYRNVTQVRNFR